MGFDLMGDSSAIFVTLPAVRLSFDSGFESVAHPACISLVLADLVIFRQGVILYFLLLFFVRRV